MKFKAGLDGRWDNDQFLYLVEDYCNRIKNDDSLEPFFGDMDKDHLISLQQEFLFAAFLRHREVNCRLNICEMFEKGISDNEFDALLEHFHLALSDSSVPGDVYDICQLYLHETRQGCKSSKGMDCPMCVLRTPAQEDPVETRKKNKGIRSVIRKIRGQS
eukprot:CAMPEP_0113628480 /NCGR_PEP_ID=MMETSP0017_2-20120614/14758_1 /TAXON_ID=2856 /ORGANISM="Cylindrotheca closterium" /LENGTH=159 /DNA_ID=CAMNT_0000538789 /DNA_START=96 /DNA_END=575 /DNA_ORIENTATION=- /assembly_acc=CAM_ASM_000147